MAEGTSDYVNMRDTDQFWEAVQLNYNTNSAILGSSGDLAIKRDDSAADTHKARSIFVRMRIPSRAALGIPEEAQLVGGDIAMEVEGTVGSGWTQSLVIYGINSTFNSWTPDRSTGTLYDGTNAWDVRVHTTGTAIWDRLSLIHI